MMKVGLDGAAVAKAASILMPFPTASLAALFLATCSIGTHTAISLIVLLLRGKFFRLSMFMQLASSSTTSKFCLQDFFSCRDGNLGQEKYGKCARNLNR
jgi:hypothetical protein